MKTSTALMICRIGAGLTVAILAAEFCSFYLHLFVLPIFGLPFLVVVTLAPALFGVSVYSRALKVDEAKAKDAKTD